MSENNVTAEELFKVALWVHDHQGPEEVWKPLQAWSEELERQEGREGRAQLVADMVCRHITGQHLKDAMAWRAETYLGLGQRIVAALDELDGEGQA